MQYVRQNLSTYLIVFAWFLWVLVCGRQKILFLGVGGCYSVPMDDQAQNISIHIEQNDGVHAEAAGLLIAQLAEQVKLEVTDRDGVRVLVADDYVQVDRKTFNYPIRLGAVMDAIIKVSNTVRDGVVSYLDLEFTFGGYRYIGAESVCVDIESNERVRLTDKERDMLGFLYQAPDHKVKRQDLLEMLWGYSSAVESHTIETHIYRLRQKIEADPSKPTLLVTEDDCYRLVVAES